MNKEEDGKEDNSECTSDDETGHISAAVGQYIGPDPRPKAYRLERKLYLGSRSSVWLAYDTEHGDYAVLEIMNEAVSQKVFEDEDSELFFHLALNGGDGSDGREKHVHDQKSGPEYLSNHVVFSFEVLGPTLNDLRQTFVPARLPLSYVKTIAKQILLALDYIHEECGIVHCDLSPNHVLLGIGSHEKTTGVIESWLKSKESSIDPETRKRKRGKNELRTAALPKNLVFDIDDIDIKLIDFNHSNWKDSPTRYPTMPAELQPPEIILRYRDFGTEVDIWSFGCMCYELLTGNALFKYADGRSLPQVDHINRIIAHTQQNIPQYLRDETLKGEVLLTDDCKPRFIVPSMMEHNGYLKECLKSHKIFDEDDDSGELDRTVAFILRCLTVDPRLRPSAVELLEDSWLKGGLCASGNERGESDLSPGRNSR